MKKTIVRIVLVLALLLIVGLVVAFLSLNKIVHKSVETVGPALA